MINTLKWDEKSPNETLDYVVNWSLTLETDEVITNSTFTCDTSSSGVTISSQSHNTTQCLVWLTGGTDGKTATIVNTITTNQNRTYTRTVLLPIRAVFKNETTTS
jgi:hypothetical protein